MLVRGVVVFPGWWLAEWSRKHPFGVSSCSGRDNHDHVSGDRAAQSNDRARPGGRLMPQGRACPGLGDPLLVCVCILVVRLTRWCVGSPGQVSRRPGRRAGGRRG